jgi:DNA polymerase III sliding clamp (beta) subunit (PCNA family)
MYVKMNKLQSKLVNWVKRAVSKDDARPVLNGININGAVVGVDGFRLHAIPSNVVQEVVDDIGEDSTVALPSLKVGENIVEPEPIEGTFPDYLQILPTKDHAVAIGVNPKFLIDALRDMDKGDAVRIVVYDENSPIEVHGRINDLPTYAIIMPMHLGNTVEDGALYWRPDRGSYD